MSFIVDKIHSIFCLPVKDGGGGGCLRRHVFFIESEAYLHGILGTV